MFLSYDDIVFQILKLDGWTREATYSSDWSTFLYWHHVIEVTCILNDDATNAENFPVLGGSLTELKTVKNPPVGGKVWKGPINKIKEGSLKVQGTVQAGDGQFPVGDIRTVGLPLINPADLSNVSGKVFGGGSIGAPGVSKGLEITQLPGIGPGFEPTNPITPGEAKGGPGPLPGDLIRKKPSKVVPKKVFVRRPVAEYSSGPFVYRNTHTIPLTDRELRGRLMRPRRSLKVWMLTGQGGAADYILVSPQQGAEADCKTGPLCSIMNNTEIIGQMTSVMQLKFETWEGPTINYEIQPVSNKEKSLKSVGNVVGNIGKLTNAMPLDSANKVTTPPVLSHRWEMSFGWDPERYLRTRKISGEVLFRADVLGLRNLSADQLRPYFMAHQIPDGYVRVPEASDAVKLNTEGTGITYSVVDRQVMMNFPGGVQYGLVNMEATTEYDYHGYDNT